MFYRGYPFSGFTADGVFNRIRIEDDVGRLLWQNLQGFRNLKGLKSRCRAREPAFPANEEKGRLPGTIAVGFNLWKKYAFAGTGLNPGLSCLKWVGWLSVSRTGIRDGTDLGSRSRGQPTTGTTTGMGVVCAVGSEKVVSS
jgi:hypothetical protein